MAQTRIQMINMDSTISIAEYNPTISEHKFNLLQWHKIMSINHTNKVLLSIELIPIKIPT